MTGSRTIFEKAAAGGGVAVVKAAGQATDEQLAKINTFALEPLTADDVFVGKLLIAHNAIDRDNERFPEDLLTDFERTFPGKSILYNHDKAWVAEGVVFEAWTEEMTPEEFASKTGEAPRLPEGVSKVRALMVSYYMLAANSYATTNIRAGIYRHCSIGIAASDLVAVRDAPNGEVKYWEYVAPGEAREASFVYLGAQNGATATKKAKKQAGDAPDNEGADKAAQEDDTMKEFIKFAGEVTGKAIADEAAAITALKNHTEQQQAEIAELKDKAAVADKYRETEEAEFVRLKTALKEGDTDTMEKTVKSLPLEFIRSENTAMAARMEKAFPTGPELAGDTNEKKDAAAGKSADDAAIPTNLK